MTLLTAGHETTATALTWALYWIHKMPAVPEKLLQELDSLGDNLDSSTILKLPYGLVTGSNRSIQMVVEGGLAVRFRGLVGISG